METEKQRANIKRIVVSLIGILINAFLIARATNELYKLTSIVILIICAIAFIFSVVSYMLTRNADR